MLTTLSNLKTKGHQNCPSFECKPVSRQHHTASRAPEIIICEAALLPLCTYKDKQADPTRHLTHPGNEGNIV
eukprot:scaffold72312_cov20-Tisochrysis_lutea.AAC.1